MICRWCLKKDNYGLPKVIEDDRLLISQTKFGSLLLCDVQTQVNKHLCVHMCVRENKRSMYERTFMYTSMSDDASIHNQCECKP